MKLVTAVLSNSAADAAGMRLVDEGFDFLRTERDGGGASLTVKVASDVADRVCTLIAETVRQHRKSEAELGLLMVKDADD